MLFCFEVTSFSNTNDLVTAKYWHFSPSATINKMAGFSSSKLRLEMYDGFISNYSVSTWTKSKKETFMATSASFCINLFKITLW